MYLCNPRVFIAGAVVFSALLPSSTQAQEAAPPLVKVDAPAVWTAAAATHVWGFPDIKAGKDGSLELSEKELTFTAKAARSAIPRSAIVAVSNGFERVELWGMKGQLLRMVIPDGGGAVAAAVLHHRVGMLTVDFIDPHGGKHSAVFDMTPELATAGLAKFSAAPAPPPPTIAPRSCDAAAVQPGSVLVAAPNWERADVPAAYRGLVYEHVISRLQGVKGVSHVYRDGEVPPDGSCPAYTIKISVQAFKQGNQIKRAAFGPAGLFIGTTSLSFDSTLSDASGHILRTEQVKATNRTQSESTQIADMFAKSLAKKYVATLKKQKTSMEAGSPAASQSAL